MTAAEMRQTIPDDSTAILEYVTGSLGTQPHCSSSPAARAGGVESRPRFFRQPIHCCLKFSGLKD